MKRKFAREGDVVKIASEEVLGTEMASYETSFAGVWANMGLTPSHTVDTT